MTGSRLQAHLLRNICSTELILKCVQGFSQSPTASLHCCSCAVVVPNATWGCSLNPPSRIVLFVSDCYFHEKWWWRSNLPGHPLMWKPFSKALMACDSIHSLNNEGNAFFVGTFTYSILCASQFSPNIGNRWHTKRFDSFACLGIHNYPNLFKKITKDEDMLLLKLSSILRVQSFVLLRNLSRRLQISTFSFILPIKNN